MSETKLAASVVSYLHDLRWDVYQEVQLSFGGPIADIVAVQGPVAWVVECKMSFSLAVLQQAYCWRRSSNLVSVATPINRRSDKTSEIKRRILDVLGVGWLTVSDDGSLYEAFRPQLLRRTSCQLRTRLHEEQKTWAEAGNARGARYTPFQATSREAQRYVKAHPGCTLKEIVTAVNHHYASDTTARTCLARWIRDGVLPLRLERDGRRYRVYAREAGE